MAEQLTELSVELVSRMGAKIRTRYRLFPSVIHCSIYEKHSFSVLSMAGEIYAMVYVSGRRSIFKVMVLRRIKNENK